MGNLNFHARFFTTGGFMFDEQQLAVEYVPIDSLVPYKTNARTHSDAQVAQ